MWSELHRYTICIVAIIFFTCHNHHSQCKDIKRSCLCCFSCVIWISFRLAECEWIIRLLLLPWVLRPSKSFGSKRWVDPLNSPVNGVIVPSVCGVSITSQRFFEILFCQNLLKMWTVKFHYFGTDLIILHTEACATTSLCLDSSSFFAVLSLYHWISSEFHVHLAPCPFQTCCRTLLPPFVHLNLPEFKVWKNSAHPSDLRLFSA